MKKKQTNEKWAGGTNKIRNVRSIIEHVDVSHFNAIVNMPKIIINQKVTRLRNVSVYWGTEDGLAPPDTPPCGFLGEFCPAEPAEDTCKCNKL